MTISEFQSYVGQGFGFSRPTRYRFEISVSKLLRQNTKSPSDVIERVSANRFRDYGLKDLHIADRLAFFCHSVQFPGKGFNVANVRQYGPNFQMPEISAYYPISATFYVGQDMMEKTFFDAWLSTIEDPVTWDYNYWTDYTTKITIFQQSDISPIPPSPGSASNIQKLLLQGSMLASDIKTAVGSASSIVNGLTKGSPGLNTLYSSQSVYRTVVNLKSLFGPDLPGHVPVINLPTSMFGNTYVCEIVDAYPLSVEPVALGFDMLDQIEAVRVTFNYRYWKNPGISTADSTLKFKKT